MLKKPKNFLTSKGKLHIISLFQAEAARFSPMRMTFCTGSGIFFRESMQLAGGFIRQFLFG